MAEYKSPPGQQALEAHAFIDCPRANDRMRPAFTARGHITSSFKAVTTAVLQVKLTLAHPGMAAQNDLVDVGADDKWTKAYSGLGLSPTVATALTALLVVDDEEVGSPEAVAFFVTGDGLAACPDTNGGAAPRA